MENIIAQQLVKMQGEILGRIVSSCSGESDNRAQGAEGLADEEGSINLAEGYSLLLESIGPIGAEYQVKLSFHVVVILIPTASAKNCLPALLVAVQRNPDVPG